MKQQRDLIISFCIALAIHGVAGVCADGLMILRRGSLVPLFKQGESSVMLTLVPSRQLSSQPPEETIERQSTTLEILAKKEEPREKDSTDNDADTLEKGVQNFSVNRADLTRPNYPHGSVLRGEEGLVRVNVTVNAGGLVEDVVVIESSGYSALDRAAVRAAKRARFISRNNHASTGSEVILSFRFKLID